MRCSTIAYSLVAFAFGAQAIAIPKRTDLTDLWARKTKGHKSKKVEVTRSAAATTVTYAGINIPGFDFGCTTSGVCPLTSTTNPGAKGIAQMQHFAANDGLNAFRLPVSWQYLVNNQLGGELDSTNFAAYDALVQGCLNVSSMCIVDIHNYARWNNETVGQSGGAVTTEHLVSLWSQLATKYASNPKVTFGLMNEPHSLNITEWATTIQAVVTAIRGITGNNHTILLPGTDYSSAGAFVYDGSSTAMSAVTNPDGSFTNLVFDVHLYLDATGAGTAPTCVTNGTTSFAPLAKWLIANGRQAFLSETGGGSTPSCLLYLCEALVFLNSQRQAFLGYTGWGAGAFETTYALSMTPLGTAGNFTDQELVSQCVVKTFTGA